MTDPLTDRFGRRHKYLRVSVTDRCNFRCRYCMPQDGMVWKPRESLLTIEETLRLVRVFAGLGIEKVRLTGGEPTVRRGLPQLIVGVAETPGIKSVHMTTNGWNLAERAFEYRERGLSGVNVSLDTLDRTRFREMTGQDAFEDVWKGIVAAVGAGFETVKINVVVMKGFNDDELTDFVALTQDLPIEVRFIEFMPFDKNDWSRDRLVSYRVMKERIGERFHLVALDGAPSAVGKEFSVPGHAGKVGFVTSMTESFCGDCDRVRLNADGGIKPCLFFPPATNVLSLLREGADDSLIVAKIQEALMAKRREHPPMQILAGTKNAAMVSIGG